MGMRSVTTAYFLFGKLLGHHCRCVEGLLDLTKQYANIVTLKNRFFFSCVLEFPYRLICMLQISSEKRGSGRQKAVGVCANVVGRWVACRGTVGRRTDRYRNCSVLRLRSQMGD